MAEVKSMSLFGNARKDELDEMYDEIITSLFGYDRKIIIEDKVTMKKVEVNRATLKNLYKPLKLASEVFKVIMRAHNDVLETGLREDKERVVVLGTKTGETIDDNVGTRNSVIFYIPPYVTEDVLTIHNHPNSMTLSPADLFTFNNKAKIICSVVQAHNGSLYALYKNGCEKYHIAEKGLEDAFDRFLLDEQHTGKAFNDNLDLFVSHTAAQLKWEYRKEL